MYRLPPDLQGSWCPSYPAIYNGTASGFGPCCTEVFVITAESEVTNSSYTPQRAAAKGPVTSLVKMIFFDLATLVVATETEVSESWHGVPITQAP